MRRSFLCLVALLCLTIATPSASATNDYTGAQWALRQVHAQEAWQVGTGAGITVGIVDTGADVSHPDFGGRVRTVKCTGTNGNASNCTAGGDDWEGHGTHVTGIIAAANDGSGTAGIAPAANVVVAQVFPPNSDADLDDVEAGVDYLISQGVAAINLSLGNSGVLGLGLFCNNSNLQSVLNKVWNAGAVAVFASGNCGSGGGNYSGVNALIVGATGPSGGQASYSNPMAGAQWGLAAPGGDGTCNSEGKECVLSTYPVSKGSYYLLQGTSMAAPHVTGAVALLRSKGLSRDQAVQAIMANLDSASCGNGCQGLLNMQRAAGAPDLGAPPPPPPPPANFGGTGGSGDRIATRRTPTTKATTPTSAVAATTVPPETTTTEAPTTTIEATSRPASRQQALKTSNDDDGIPALPAILGVAGLLAAAGATGLAQWRRSRGGAGL